MNAGYRRILVAIDDSHAAQRALGEGIGIAQAPGGELRIIHVLEGQSIALTFNPYARYYTRDLVRQLCGRRARNSWRGRRRASEPPA
ncbi:MULTISPECIES: universal stress protein [Achromobacter]|uniref:universal stress protein n=1 Tax=Achromobacter TaxID=222 RepID=UPI0004B50E15|nr:MULTISPECIES: universal stress protein [Achromobacter]CUI49267.1 Universal stress protein family [Achromobacter xylosoxidans]CUI62474.1 Universal stress protein family [Achromobacter xylosoxidans]CUK06525.1 Universal stress protein family [Achromobacter xylosoxidans]